MGVPVFIGIHCEIGQWYPLKSFWFLACCNSSMRKVTVSLSASSFPRRLSSLFLWLKELDNWGKGNLYFPISGSLYPLFLSLAPYSHASTQLRSFKLGQSDSQVGGWSAITNNHVVGPTPRVSWQSTSLEASWPAGSVTLCLSTLKLLCATGEQWGLTLTPAPSA